MVAASNEKLVRMTEAEYLAFEEQSELKHEFVNGEILAMTGASWHHALICTNIGAAIGQQIINKDLAAVLNFRLKVGSAVYRYPDVMVVCGEPEFVNKRVDTISNPTVIIEVLSTATALIDRNEKLREYRQIDTVQEYLLVPQNEARIEKFVRQNKDVWIYTETIGLVKALDLPSIGCVLKLADVYKKISFDSNTKEETDT
jgi:Uma2 family endonuclease